MRFSKHCPRGRRGRAPVALRDGSCDRGRLLRRHGRRLTPPPATSRRSSSSGTKVPPAGVPSVGDLKTKVKIVKVPRLWTVDQTIAFYRSLPGVTYAEPNFVADQHGLAAPNDPYFGEQWGLAKIDALAGWDVYPGTYAPRALRLRSSTRASTACTLISGRPGRAGRQLHHRRLRGVRSEHRRQRPRHGQRRRGRCGGEQRPRCRRRRARRTADSGQGAERNRHRDVRGDRSRDHLGRRQRRQGDQPLSRRDRVVSRTLCDAVTYALDKGRVRGRSLRQPQHRDARSTRPPAAASSESARPTRTMRSRPGRTPARRTCSSRRRASRFTPPTRGDRYALATGTSVSTALVSGLASLLIGQDPARTPAEVRRILATTSDKVGPGIRLRRRSVPHVRWLLLERRRRLRADQRSPRALRRQSTRRRPLPPDPGASPAPPPASAASGAAAAPPPPLPRPPTSRCDGPRLRASAVQGTAATYALSIAGQNGFDGTVSLAISGLPTGASAAFAPASVPASGSSTLNVSVASETPVGSYTLTVRAPAIARAHRDPGTRGHCGSPPPAGRDRLHALGDAGLADRQVRQAGADHGQGDRPTAGRSPGVQPSISGLPIGVTASFQARAAGVWTLTLDVAATAPRFQTVTVTIAGRLGSITRTTTVVITVL